MHYLLGRLNYHVIRFFRLIVNFFISHHSFTFNISWLTKVSSSMELGEEMNMLVSSANILKDNFSEQFGMSLIYVRNSSGPGELGLEE